MKKPMPPKPSMGKPMGGDKGPMSGKPKPKEPFVMGRIDKKD